MIRSAAVLGAGTMGAQIAAHLANAGVQTMLLDLTPELARQGLERARRLKPDPFFTSDTIKSITTAAFDDLSGIAGADWIVEAVVEDLAVKRALLERVEAVRGPGSIVTSNTSGIPIAAIAEGRSDEFRRHWLGTHFFNPPRYLRLLEIIPTSDTDPSVVATLSRFADIRLGKGVVIAKDTPNFIANHIGLHGLLQILRTLESGEHTIEEIDAMTGPAIGRPKSATFRTMDIAGSDVLGHVVRNLAERLPDDAARRAFALPSIVAQLIARGWVGEKSGRGFYERRGKPDGSSEIFTLDPATFTYRPKQPARLPALDAARSIEDVGVRIRTLFLDDSAVGAFLRRTLGSTLLYTARVAPEIAHSIDDVDRAAQWGFGWELGPFEICDAIGLRELLTALGNPAPPPLIEAVLAAGRNQFRDSRVPPAGSDLQILRAAKDRERILRRNAEASLVDLGDGALAVEFHSKMNAIGADTIEMMNAGVKEAEANFAALVIGNDGVHFSAGANLVLLLFAAHARDWDQVDTMIQAAQKATAALRYASVPVVVCPSGMTLGGGCEICLHGARVQASAETYMGLVETSVGIIPAAGGTKEMLARSVEPAPPPQADLLPSVRRVFETIGTAKVSISGVDAMRLGLLRDADGITMNRERLMSDAKAVALGLAREGYRPPVPRTAIPVGGDSVLAALKLAVHLAWRAGHISEHDALIGRTLATILAGGALPHRTTVTEEYLLELEREAFLKLCGEAKTLARLQHTLMTGKPLRN
jgi:3-hydroxyacyl-CoA dehydrogenase